MDYNEALPFLQANNLGVVTTVGKSGRVQATVVSAGAYDGKVVYTCREEQIKVKNVRNGSRSTVTIVRPDNRRYVTVEGPAVAIGWDNTSPEELLPLLQNVQQAVGRKVGEPEEFERAMRNDRRTIIFVTPEHIYGSL